MSIFFKISSDAKMGVDTETGEPCPAYMKIAGFDFAEGTPEEDIKKAVLTLLPKDMIQPEHLTIITEKDYMESTGEDDSDQDIEDEDNYSDYDEEFEE